MVRKCSYLITLLFIFQLNILICNAKEISGEIKLNVLDNELKNINSTYEIYSSKNKLIYKINATIAGTYLVSDLPFGSYYIKEFNNSLKAYKRIWKIAISKNKVNELDINPILYKIEIDNGCIDLFNENEIYMRRYCSFNKDKIEVPGGKYYVKVGDNYKEININKDLILNLDERNIKNDLDNKLEFNKKSNWFSNFISKHYLKVLQVLLGYAYV